MAELTTRERRQPCLLDRLTDDEPGAKTESRDKRVLSATQMRQGVLRDLEWLLNTGTRFDQTELADTPLVATSVLNFGMPDLTGLTASGIAEGQIEKMITEAILRFEPRILKRGLKVKAAGKTRGRDALVATIFEIRGELWAQPMPEALYVKTEVDLESGQAKVKESSGG
jgi:type VI secretion system protein ImpF